MTAKPTYEELEQRIRVLEETAKSELMQTAVDASSDAIGMSTADGRHFYQNKSFDHMFGYTLEEVSRLNPRILYGNERVANEVFETTMNGSSWHGEIEMVAKNGRCFPVLLRADAIKDKNGDIIGLIGVYTDITERKRAENELRKFKTICDESGYGISIVDLEGNVIYNNMAFDRMHGYTPGELTGKHFSIHHTEQQMAKVNSLAEQLNREGGYLAEEVWHKRRDNSEFPTLMTGTLIKDKNGTPLFMAGTAIDITEIKLAEAKIRESEEKYRLLFDTTEVLLSVYDRDGVCQLMNRRVAALFGGEPKDFIGKSIIELHPKDGRDYLRSFRETIDSGITHEREDKVEFSQGNRWLLTRLQPLPDAQGVFRTVQIISQDITDRKLAEEALRFEREQLLSVFDSIDEIIYVSDPDTYKILYANKTLKDAFQKNVIGGICYRELQGFDSPCHFCTNDIIRKQKYAPYSWEYHNPVLNRDYAIVDRIIRWPDGRDVRFELAIDITERKQVEEALQRYNQRLMIMHQIDRDIAIARSPKAIAETTLKHIRELVPCWMASIAMYEPDTDELIVLHSDADGHAALQPGVRIPTPEGWVSRMLKERYNLVEDTDVLPEPIPPSVRMAISEGTRSYLSSSLVAEGNLIGALILASRTPSAFSAEALEIGQEVASQLALAIHQARMKEQIEAHAAELEEKVAQRTAELQDINAELQAFAYSVSHDLKAPLRGIDGYSRLLLQDYADKLDEEGRTFLQTIRSASQQMSQLIDDLLAYSRLERRAMRIGKINPRSLAEMVITERGNELQERKVALSVDVPCGTVSAEAEGLIMALRNLLENALKYSRDSLAPCIEIGGRETGKACILWVRDNGIGFDMQYHDRIFEIFQRLHPAEDYSGTGIGLAIVRKVMQRMGGRVWADSTPGHGATFYLEVPK